MSASSTPKILKVFGLVQLLDYKTWGTSSYRTLEIINLQVTITNLMVLLFGRTWSFLVTRNESSIKKCPTNLCRVRRLQRLILIAFTAHNLNCIRHII